MKIFRCSGVMLGACGLLLGPLSAAPRSIADCEKIQATDAYNQCLASFGPVAHLKPMTPLPAGGDGGGSHGHAHYRSHYRYHGVATGHRHGRHSAVLTTGGAHGHH